MRAALLPAALLLAAAGLAGNASAQAPPADLRAVLAASLGDWNEDGFPDRAVLVESRTRSYAADLVVHLSESGPELGPPIHAIGIAWRGETWGQLPTLSLSATGALEVVSENQSIGRDRWRRVLTIAQRDGALVVVGLRHDHRDTLDLSRVRSCEVDFLTGDGLLDGRPIRTAMPPTPIALWRDDTTPAECPIWD
jgi:hypothetical protein